MRMGWSRFYGSDYNKLRKKVFKRDKYTCQLCKKRKRKIEAHHIFKYSTYASLREEERNLITLCKDCHASIKDQEHIYMEYFIQIINRHYDNH